MKKQKALLASAPSASFAKLWPSADFLSSLPQQTNRIFFSALVQVRARPLSHPATVPAARDGLVVAAGTDLWQHATVTRFIIRESWGVEVWTQLLFRHGLKLKEGHWIFTSFSVPCPEISQKIVYLFRAETTPFPPSFIVPVLNPESICVSWCPAIEVLMASSALEMATWGKARSKPEGDYNRGMKLHLFAVKEAWCSGTPIPEVLIQVLLCTVCLPSGSSLTHS